MKPEPCRSRLTAELGIRVIVADDEVLLCEGLVRLLGEAGFDVIGRAGDAVELLRLIERGGGLVGRGYLSEIKEETAQLQAA